MGFDRHTSERMAEMAENILKESNPPLLEVALAKAVLAEAQPGFEPSAAITIIADEVFGHAHDFSKTAVSLAASIVSQEAL